MFTSLVCLRMSLPRNGRLSPSTNRLEYKTEEILVLGGKRGMTSQLHKKKQRGRKRERELRLLLTAVRPAGETVSEPASGDEG